MNSEALKEKFKVINSQYNHNEKTDYRPLWASFGMVALYIAINSVPIDKGVCEPQQAQAVAAAAPALKR